MTTYKTCSRCRKYRAKHSGNFFFTGKTGQVTIPTLINFIIVLVTALIIVSTVLPPFIAMYANQSTDATSIFLVKLFPTIIILGIIGTYFIYLRVQRESPPQY